MKLNEAKKILEDNGYIVEGIVKDGINFAKRMITGQTKLEQLINDKSIDEGERLVYKRISRKIQDYAIANQETYGVSVEKICNRYGNDDKLIVAIKNVASVFGSSVEEELEAGNKNAAKKELNKAANKIIDLIDRGY